MVDSPQGVVPLSPVEVFRHIATWLLSALSQLTINLLGSPSVWGRRVSVLWRTVIDMPVSPPPPSPSKGALLGIGPGAWGDPGQGEMCPAKLVLPVHLRDCQEGKQQRGRIRHRG